jgi:membrane fusion protein (multidrug efflux system)
MYVDLTRSSVDLLRLRKQSLASNSDTLSVTLTLEDGSTYRKKGVWRSPKSPSMNPPAR